MRYMTYLGYIMSVVLGISGWLLCYLVSSGKIPPIPNNNVAVFAIAYVIAVMISINNITDNLFKKDEKDDD